jgi:hypothetical protein
LESEELSNPGIIGRKINVDPDPYNLGPRVNLLHQMNLITAFFDIALVDTYGVCPKIAYTFPQAHMP